jgi:hypothetical protein
MFCTVYCTYIRIKIPYKYHSFFLCIYFALKNESNILRKRTRRISGLVTETFSLKEKPVAARNPPVEAGETAPLSTALQFQNAEVFFPNAIAGGLKPSEMLECSPEVKANHFACQCCRNCPVDQSPLGLGGSRGSPSSGKPGGQAVGTAWWPFDDYIFGAA